MALAALLLLAGSPAGAFTCPADTRLFDDYLAEAVKKEVYKGDPREILLRDTPTFAPRAQQDSSPSGNGTDATVVNAPDFTTLLSAAFDQTAGNADGDDEQGYTLNINPFLLAVLYDNDNYYSPAQYMDRNLRMLRRLGASVTFGGKGESFDRDGDGVKEDALDASSPDDIITWEFRARLLGSRDRRERFTEILQAMDQTSNFELTTESKRAIIVKLVAGGAFPNDALPCIRNDKLEVFKPEIDELINLLIAENTSVRSALEKIDNDPLVTAVVTGVERKHDFGSDKHGIGLRATWLGFDGNAEWLHMSGLTKGAEDMDQFKLGLDYKMQLLKGWELDGWRLVKPEKASKGWLKNGIDASVSAALEIYDDTPDVSHDTNVKLQGKLEIPVTEGVRLPLSITWANHEDLLDKDDRIVGHFGINVDTSKLSGLVKGLL
jgi:hypothetical protein